MKQISNSHLRWPKGRRSCVKYISKERINNESIASVPNLLVMHSHGKKFLQFLQEWKNWREMYENVEEYIKNNP